MSIDRLIELFSHADADWRQQGRELMRALGDEAGAEVLRRVTRGEWLWPVGEGDATDLVAALATIDGLAAQRARIRELPPITATDAKDIEAVAKGFPNATLRLFWDRSPDDVSFLQRLPCTSLQLSVGSWTAEPPELSSTLRRLAFFGSVPELHAPGLRELDVASWSSAWFETTFDRLASQLERLHVRNRSGELPDSFPKLRDLRIPSLDKSLRTDAPLERLHVGETSGRSILNRSLVGPHTRIRVDDWPQPDPSLVGDPRLVWIGAQREGWQSILDSLPNLEVAEVADPADLPPNVLPTPWMLTEQDLGAERRRSALDGWARRGRSWRLRSRQRTRAKIMAIKQIRTFSAWGLAHAKRFFEAIDEDRLVALSAHEAHYWRALLRESGMGLEISAS